MSPHVCLRCLTRQSILDAAPLSRLVRPSFTSNAFSTTRPALAAPPKKQSGIGKAPKKRVIGFTKRGRPSGGGSAPGRKDPVAAKALRRRIVLSNANALVVPGLAELSASNVLAEDAVGKMLTLSDNAIDSLRAVEAFDHTQNWGLFRKPSTLITEHTQDLARAINAIEANKSTESQIIAGDRGSGKSVLALQALTLAFEKGWIVVHIPDAQELTVGHTSYTPLRQGDGSTQYIQTDYTALLLGRIGRANAAVLSSLTISRQHNTLPIPIQPNMSLLRLAELGAADANIAWPIFTALFSELITPSSEAHPRPPICLCLDRLAHASTLTNYLSSDLKPVHAHDLALVALFNALLAQRARSPNGALVLAVDSGSNRPAVPALDYALQTALGAQNQQRRSQQSSESGRYNPVDMEGPLYRAGNPVARPEVKRAFQLPYEAYDARVTGLVLGANWTPASSSLEAAGPSPFLDYRQRRRRHTRPGMSGTPTTEEEEAHEARDEVEEAQEEAQEEVHEEVVGSDNELDVEAATKEAQAEPVKEAKATTNPGATKGAAGAVYVRNVAGLSREQTRRLMEYYARSGMLRGTVDARRVSEEWTLSGGGVVGLLEDALVKMRV